jgi:biopolymer transport protein ExbD
VLVKSISRKRLRPSQFLNGIDFWAFLSIELVLLMIFMVQVPQPFHQMAMDFARTDHATLMPGALRGDAMLVSIKRDGNIFFGSHQIRDTELPATIRESLLHGSERKVYLKVDARARYGDAAIVIDQVRQAGIENIGIITEQRQPLRPQP